MLYDLIVSLFRPAAWWGRLRVEGLDRVPTSGPLLVVPNHDSQWDPVVVGLAIKPRRRLRFLARASLWRISGLGPVLDALGQIPIRRGSGDAGALERAIEVLSAGEAVCVFPEGRLSWGEHLRAHSGVGRLAASCAPAQLLLCEVKGTTDYARFPRRPRVSVRFLAPAEGNAHPGEEPGEIAARLLAELREEIPPTPAGRRPVVGGPPRVQRALARSASRS
ncbi:MAG: 1-acyl-sn-glycerol-3-phosphate acyltransferase [Solirubrobacterales bacterium]|nr:1-acyl-sn-glycerol-3-phosphate acyltransferase [Solirubrobacterales bacterium]